MSNAVARCGGWSVAVGDRRLLDSLVASLSYRLEPEGFGSRFPVLLGEALAGRLEPSRAGEALRELEIASHELRELPPSKAIDTLDERKPLDLSALPFGAASSLYDLYRTPEGRPMLEVIAEALQVCQQRNTVLTLRAGPAHRALWVALGLTIAGLVGTALAWHYLPDYLISHRKYSGSFRRGDAHGTPLWAWVAIVGWAGLAELAKALSPPLATFVERRFWLFRVLAAVACIAWILVWWR